MGLKLPKMPKAPKLPGGLKAPKNPISTVTGAIKKPVDMAKNSVKKPGIKGMAIKPSVKPSKPAMPGLKKKK